MDITFLDATKKSLSGVAIPIRDPRVKRGDADEDTRPFLRENDEDSKSPLVTITILGPDHPRVSKLLAPQRARYMQQALMATTRKGVRLSPVDVQAEEAENMAIAVAATVDWSGWRNAGELWPCTPENAEHLYTINRDVMEQVLAALRERANFLPVSKGLSLIHI